MKFKTLKNKQLKNIMWMFLDKAFLFFGSFIVSVMVARYLGPDNLGLISYGIALGTLAIAISQWGANYIIFNTAAVNKIRSVLYIAKSEKIRMYIFFASFITLNMWLLTVETYSGNSFYIISLVLFSQIFLALDVYQYHYNATLRSKINAKSNIVAKTISMFIRFCLVYFNCSVYLFVIPFFIEGGIIYFLRKKSLIYPPITKLSSHRRNYFNIGTPLVITSVCVAIYSKMYEVLLGNLISYNSVGIYSVGAVINGAWSFIPMAIGISLVSKPMQEKVEDRIITGYSFVSFSVLMVSIPILVFIYYFSENIVHLTFGDDYSSASEILFILSIGSVCATLGYITNRMISSFPKGAGYLLKKVLLSSVILCLISYCLIDKYGVKGAAYGYLVSELLNLTIFNYFFNKGLVFKIHRKIIFSYKYYINYR